ncbi:MAG: transposase [Gammaproteobacteria bacterium]|nr:transposase [Gammaproteobacteria bacterium]
MAARLRAVDVIRCCWENYNRNTRIVPESARVIRKLLDCRTAALGGHLHRCDRCGGEVPVYNSCENRHCPNGQTGARMDWTQKRLSELLPVPYFHVVFTLPHRLNPLVDANRKLLLGELFGTAGWTLQRFARDPQWRLEGELGYTAVLHTWNQKLQEHFHLHCLVPGGVWRKETGEWIPCRGRWLFRKESLADAFRNRYLKRLRSLRQRGKMNLTGCADTFADESSFEQLLADLGRQRWIVYPKAVPKDPQTALKYLARYVFKTAISNQRIINMSAFFKTTPQMKNVQPAHSPEVCSVTEKSPLYTRLNLSRPEPHAAAPAHHQSSAPHPNLTSLLQGLYFPPQFPRLRPTRVIPHAAR